MTDVDDAAADEDSDARDDEHAGNVREYADASEDGAGHTTSRRRHRTRADMMQTMLPARASTGSEEDHSTTYAAYARADDAYDSDGEHATTPAHVSHASGVWCWCVCCDAEYVAAADDAGDDELADDDVAHAARDADYE